MSSFPQVTVICTCYNHEDYVVDALNSVINQTYPNIQLIITDDFSSDNSRNIIRNWLNDNPNVLFIENDKNIGNTKTFNNAFTNATGKYFVDLAADDMLLEKCIEVQVDTFKSSKHKKLAVVYGNIDLIDEREKLISIYYDETHQPESGDIYKMVIGRTTMICSTASMIKSSVFISIGGYDETLAYEDLDLWVRVSRFYKFEYIPEILAKKRELDKSLSSNFQKSNILSKRLHISNIKILNKILNLNTSKDEYLVMINRIKFEAKKMIKSGEYKLLFNLIYIGCKALLKSI